VNEWSSRPETGPRGRVLSPPGFLLSLRGRFSYATSFAKATEVKESYEGQRRGRKGDMGDGLCLMKR